MGFTSVLAVVLLLVYVYRKLKKIYSVFEIIGIPGPKPVWIFGNIHEFKDTDKLSVFKEWRKRFGDIYGFFEGFTPSIVVCDPEMSRLILVKHFEKFHIRPIYNPFLYYPDEYSLLNSSGPKWRSQRTAVIAALNATPITTVLHRLCQSCEIFVNKLNNESSKYTDGFDIGRVIDHFTLDAFSYAAFDHEVQSMKNEDAVLYQYMRVFNESSSADNPLAGLARVYSSLTPFLQLFDTKHRDIHNQHIQELRQLMDERIQKKTSATPDNAVDFLLQTTIQTSSNESECRRHLTKEEIIAHLNTVIGGGLGTTNAALSFVVHQLVVHPDVQQKVFEEVCDHCGLTDKLDMTSIQKLRYLDCVVNESLRVLPCAPGLARECSESCTINGVQFKKGMVIRIMMCALYDDNSIFKDPQLFSPERFTEEESAKRHQNTFLPFGQGPRMCPGFKIATLMIKVAIIFILRNFIMKKCDKTEDPLSTALRPMLVPRNGVYVTLLQRNNNSCN